MAKDLLEAVLDGGEPIAAEELAAIPELAGIRKEIWGKFPGAIVRKRYKPGDVLMRQGEYGTTAFFVLSGTIEISINAGAPTRQAKPPQSGFLGKLTHLTDYLKGVPPARRQPDAPTHIPIDGPVDLPMNKPLALVGRGEIIGELAALAALKQDRLKRPKFYPRSATAVAKTPEEGKDTIEVLEMLPNILNNVLYPAPAFKKKLDDNYRARALETHLRSVPLFRQLSAEFIETLKKQSKLIDIEPGKMICAQGDPADSFFLIRMGFVKVSQVFPGGELVLTYLSRGSYFGELGLLSPVFRVRAKGPKPGQTAEGVVANAPVKLGRAPGSADALAAPWDEYISRAHASMQVEGKQLLVERLPSGKNPLDVNGKPVERVLLSPGEKFSIGETTFEVFDDPLQAGRRSATCTAVDYVQLVQINREEFSRILEGFPEIAAEITEVARARRQMDLDTLGRVQQVSLGTFLQQDLMQGQNLLLLDLDKCTRCDECVKACVNTHKDGETRLVRDGLRFENFLVPTSCRACLDPLCMMRCPVGSIRRKQSLDIVIEDWCIGCCNCAVDCPFGNINVVQKMVGQQAEMRPMAVVCDLCVEYAEPNCVRACPHDSAIRVESRSFFARDLAGIQLAVAPEEPTPQNELDVADNMETRLFSNVNELLGMLPQLKIIAGPGTGSYLQLRYPSTSFGRGAGNDYRFAEDSLMSRAQAAIVCEESRFILRDLKSTNGTLVNGEPISEIQLQPGDVIEMGEMRMEFLQGNQE